MDSKRNDWEGSPGDLRQSGFQELSDWRFCGISYCFKAIQVLEMRACKGRRDKNSAGASKLIWF